ncbi:hypothetical protein ACOZ38_29035 [Sphaerisporangium viridialbum]|uniref:hypothetical protein n=1 Tax=Sphaerisporangium viridialbum TaxID=46189 RepID=UPI003C73AEAA
MRARVFLLTRGGSLVYPVCLGHLLEKTFHRMLETRAEEILGLNIEDLDLAGRG